MKKLLVCVNILCLFIVGCSDSDGSGKKDGGKQDTSSYDGTIIINGKTPKEYYERFTSEVIGTCEDDYMGFRYVSTDQPVFHVDENQIDYRLGGDLYLYKDNTFIFAYEEHKVSSTGKIWTSVGYNYDVSYEEKVSGKWRIEGSKLILGDLGYATGITVNGNDRLMIMFQKDLNLSGLKDLDVFASYVSGTSGLQTINEYCNRN